MSEFLGRGRSPGGEAFERSLGEHPDNPYAASVLLNFGMHDRGRGAFTKALHKLELSWTLAEDATDPEGIAVADRAAAEWASLHLAFGNMGGLAHVFSEVEGRTLSGSSGQKLALAREGYLLLHHHHDQAVPSARTALRRLLLEIHGRGYCQRASEIDPLGSSEN